MAVLAPISVIRSHSFSFVVTHCLLMSLVVIRSLSLVVPLIITSCTTRYTTRYHLLSFVISRCTTRFHLMYHSSVFL